MSVFCKHVIRRRGNECIRGILRYTKDVVRIEQNIPFPHLIFSYVSSTYKLHKNRSNWHIALVQLIKSSLNSTQVEGLKWVYRKEYLHPDFSFIPFDACSIPFNACYLGRREKTITSVGYLNKGYPQSTIKKDKLLKKPRQRLRPWRRNKPKQRTERLDHVPTRTRLARRDASTTEKSPTRMTLGRASRPTSLTNSETKVRAFNATANHFLPPRLQR
jgi:hypothetical protein